MPVPNTPTRPPFGSVFWPTGAVTEEAEPAPGAGEDAVGIVPGEDPFTVLDSITGAGVTAMALVAADASVGGATRNSCPYLDDIRIIKAIP